MRIAEWISGLRLAQGEGAGGPFRILPWQRRFLARMEREQGDLALSMGRGGGKTTFAAALALAGVFGPLRRPGGEVVLVAGSFSQAKLAFDHAVAFLGDEAAEVRRSHRGRIQDHSNKAEISWDGCRLRCVSSDPRRAHGLAPSLAILDEVAVWPGTTVDAMLSAISTSMGKIPGSRLVAIGTRPAAAEHPFSVMLDGPGGTVYAAGPDDPIGWRRTWAKANPSLRYMPALEARIRREAAEAKVDKAKLAQFRALRLNLGVSDVEEALLLDAATWARIEGDAERAGPYVLGLDLGGSSSMSAAAGFWTDTGRLDALGCFPAVPSLAERGLADGVGARYSRMADRGELLVLGQRVADAGGLVTAAVSRWGVPAALVCDRYRLAELREVLAGLSWSCPLVTRGQGWRDGSEDVRAFQAAALRGDLVPVRSLLLRYAVGGARLVYDAAANPKLSRMSAGGRRSRHRDDAAAAAVLAVAHGSRVQVERMARPRYTGSLVVQ